MKSSLEGNSKPKDWPVNNREAKLEYVYRAAENFRNDPSYRTREMLLALLNEHDLNQCSYVGNVRITKYEVELMNLLYRMGNTYNINSLKTFLYEVIADTTRMQKMNSWISKVLGETEGINIPEYEEILILPLKLYHFAYQKYNVDKDKNLAEKIVEFIKEILAYDSSEKILNSVTEAYIQMLNDLSYMHGTKKTHIWRFSRDELSMLFDLEIDLILKTKLNPMVNPLKRVLMTQISNFILKSRNEYNEDYLCKYVSPDVAKAGAQNHQIWMKKTILLNDEREEKVVPELFQEDNWIPCSWAKRIDFSETRTYFVSSFSKEINNEDMKKEYGGCIYGYKDDRIAELIAPLSKRRITRRNEAEVDNELPKTIIYPFLSEVIAFDVIYDREEAKQELTFLIKIIDKFSVIEAEKKAFLQDIMQYWILSVKDEKWDVEKERRYVLFLYDEYVYEEMECDDTFLRVKTSIFLTPDFILGEKNPTKNVIQKFVDEKRKHISWNGYIFCRDCMNRDFDIFTDERIKSCPICKSSNIERVNP